MTDTVARLSLVALVNHHMRLSHRINKIRLLTHRRSIAEGGDCFYQASRDPSARVESFVIESVMSLL